MRILAQAGSAAAAWDLPADAETTRAGDASATPRAGLTRQELATAMELNLTTVTRLAGGLIDEGLLVPRARAGGAGPGRPSEELTLEPRARHAVGLEFGREHLLGAVVDATGAVVARRRLDDPPPFEGTAAVAASLGDAARAFSEATAVPWSTVAAVGIALHDVVDASGRWSIHEAPRAAPYPIAAELERRFRRALVAEDVSRAFAFAEQRRGAGVGRPDITYLFVGQHGVGGGIFVNGRPLKSSTGVCGEVGHVVVAPGGKQCHCGARGCLETVATPGAVVERYLDLAAQGVPATLDATTVSFPELCAAADTGDKAAYVVLDELAGALAIALAASINVGGGAFVIIGGPLRLAGEAFRGHLEAELKRRVVGPLLQHVSVSFASLGESAGAWGVALQALERAIHRGSFVNVETEPRTQATGRSERTSKKDRPVTAATR